MADQDEILVELDEYRGREGRDDSTEKKEKEDFVYDEEAPNLVTVFMDNEEGKGKLNEISERVTRDFESAWDSTEEYRAKRADDWAIFVGELPEKEFPWENCANAQVPIALETITRLVFRATGELFGDWSNVFGVLPTGPDDMDQAEILSKHGNWQLRNRIPDFDRQMQRALLMYFMGGDVTIHSYWDASRRENRHEALTPDEFVVPFVFNSTMPDYSDVPYYVRIHRYHQYQLEALRDVWEGVDEVLERKPPGWSNDPEAKMADREAEIKGISIPEDDDSGEYVILQYEGYMELPNQQKQRFVQVFMDHATGNILHMSIWEQPSWDERVRYDRQVEDLEQWKVLRRRYDELAGEMDAMDAQMAASGGEPLPREPTETPAAPGWIEEPAEALLDDDFEPQPMEMTALRMFAHGVCIEPLTGSLGIGFGRIQADFNRAANTMFNQFIDSATMANAPGWFHTDLLDFEGDIELSPGSMQKVTAASGAELKNNLMPINTKPANGQLMEATERLYEWGQSSIQAPAVLSGEPGKSGETARGLATRIEQATKQLSVSTQKFANGVLTQTLRNNARLNAIFASDEEIVMVNDKRMGTMEEITVGRAMYQRDYRVQIRADLKFSSEVERQNKADELVRMSVELPFMQQALAFQWEAMKKSLEARDLHDMVPLLGPRPPAPVTAFGLPPPPPPGMLPPGAPPGGGPPPSGQPPGAPGPAGPPPPGPTE